MNDDYSSWKGWSPQSFAAFSAADGRYFDWHVARALPGRDAPLNILELGFGNGGFLGWARERGHTITGIEINADLVARARALGFSATTGLDGVAEAARFDLIAGFDVLEHVDLAQLPKLLRELADRMRPGGAMIFRFPNGDSPWSGPLQHGDTTHLSVLSTARMRQVAGSCGLTVTHSGERLPWRALPPSRRAGAVAETAARKVFEWLLRKMYAIGRGLDFAPNQLVVIARPAS